MQSVKRSFSSGMSSDWEAVEMYLITYAELSLLLRLFPYIPPAPTKQKRNEKKWFENQFKSEPNYGSIPFRYGSVQVHINLVENRTKPNRSMPTCYHQWLQHQWKGCNQGVSDFHYTQPVCHCWFECNLCYSRIFQVGCSRWKWAVVDRSTDYVRMDFKEDDVELSNNED